MNALIHRAHTCGDWEEIFDIVEDYGISKLEAGGITDEAMKRLSAQRASSNPTRKSNGLMSPRRGSAATTKTGTPDRQEQPVIFVRCVLNSEQRRQAVSDCCW